MKKIAVMGGCGRLGLRFSLIATNKGHKVTAIDIDEERMYEINNGSLPFVEPGAEVYLEEAIKKKLLKTTYENEAVATSDVVIITLGTPVDSNLNPSLEPVAGVIFDIAEHLKAGQLLIFRNTIAPGITERLKVLIENKSGLKIGKDIFVVFAPEILNPNQSIHDLNNTAQPIGAFDNASFKQAAELFKTMTTGKLTWVSPEEALIAKLMTNMFNYMQAATANEFYLIAETFGVNINNILESCELHNTLKPSLNSSGPGMHKEGWLLVDRIPFTDLITTSFKINESMQSQIVQKLEHYNLNKVVVLGMTSKANSDISSGSLSYKLRKALFYKDYMVGCFDPFLPEYSDSSVLKDADAVILMTPHDEFKDFEKIKKLVENANCLYVDINGFWEETRQKAEGGIYKPGQKKVNRIKK